MESGDLNGGSTRGLFHRPTARQDAIGEAQRTDMEHRPRGYGAKGFYRYVPPDLIESLGVLTQSGGPLLGVKEPYGFCLCFPTQMRA